MIPRWTFLTPCVKDSIAQGVHGQPKQPSPIHDFPIRVRKNMSVELHLNGQRASVEPGSSLFDYAERLDVRVPTSCRKNGKCKECVVEIIEGMERLSKPGVVECHLRDNFRLACCCKIMSDSGIVRCRTMRRGEMRIERHAFQLPAQSVGWRLDPAVTRKGERVFWTAGKLRVPRRLSTGWRWIWERRRLSCGS